MDSIRLVSIICALIVGFLDAKISPCTEYSVQTKQKGTQMMKKLLTLLAAAALFLTLTACGKEDTSQETAPSPSEQTTSTTQPTTTAPSQPEAKFEEIVLVDNQEVTFKITNVTNDPIWGYTLKVFMENKTDLDLMFTVENVSINGYMCDPFWATSVSAGKKANQSISWLESTLKENGIEAVEEITFTLRAYDNNDWLAEDVFSETFTVNP